jgi:hypothetical protein
VVYLVGIVTAAHVGTAQQAPSRRPTESFVLIESLALGWAELPSQLWFSVRLTRSS